MQDPSSTAQSAITFAGSAGITLFGIVLGLRPDLMLAGLWGALWALSYSDPMPLYRRVTLAFLSSVLAGYGTPAVMVLIEHANLLQSDAAQQKLQYPVAVGVGFLAHRVLGPFLLRFAQKKADEAVE